MSPIPEIWSNAYALIACVVFGMASIISGVSMMSHRYERALLLACISLAIYAIYLVSDGAFSSQERAAWGLVHILVSASSAMLALTTIASGIGGALAGIQKRNSWKAKIVPHHPKNAN